MQADLAQTKFVFFKNKNNFTRINSKTFQCAIISSFVFLSVLSVFFLVSKALKPSMGEESVKKEIVVTKSFAAENVEVFKYFSNISTNVSKEEIQKNFPQYEISSKEFKPSTGWMRKDNLHIHFDISAQGLYISYNGLKVAQAYELKEAFNSVALGYETEVTLDKDRINIVVSNYKSKSAQLLNPVISSIEESVKKNQEIRQIMQDIQKKHNELVPVFAIESSMNILHPVTHQKIEQNQIKQLNEKLESIKINNLIIQEQIKQAELLKKLSKS